jgi:hypothetical protein
MPAPRARDRLAGLAPALGLIALAAAWSALLYALSGGREIGDDAPELLRLCRHPLALFGDYRAAGIGPNFASYPPLLPLLFGAGVRPWLPLVPDFWAIRIGVLGWTLCALALIGPVARSAGLSGPQTRRALWLFVLLPTPWAAAALIPQEEAYVALYAVALYLAAASGREALLAPLFLAAVLAGKYFLLILALPLAACSPTPIASFVRSVTPAGVGLGAYVAYHALAFDHPIPILAHRVGATGSLSMWTPLWALGVRLDPTSVKAVSLLLTGAGVLGFCLLGHRRGLDRLSAAAGSLYLMLITLYITLPAYVLWALPLMVVCVWRMPDPRHRWAGVIGLFVWSAAEWGANLFRGVALALSVERTPGKQAIAGAVERVLGAGFPYHAVSVGLTALLIVTGAALIALLLRDAASRSSGSDLRPRWDPAAPAPRP